ncbi:MAG: hypothetical protein HQM08_18040 [Candidatus Riflebacteria bacterium]|nr:hypothetical protein [Candidatus Riflebacteria bacterium]
MSFTRFVGISALVILAMVLISFEVLYHSFFVYVPAGHMLVLNSQSGDAMPPGQLLAKPDQKGVLEEVLGEGLHFIMPLVYKTEIYPNINVPAGKVGIVTSRVGKKPSRDSVVVNDDEQGVRRRVLTPGTYRLNPYGYKVDLQEAVTIRPGFVGFVTSLGGKNPSDVNSDLASPTGRIFAREGEKGIRKDILQPGVYYFNPMEVNVNEVEIGIDQVSFLDANTIRFPSKDAFDIAVEATVEWELLPENVAEVMVEFGNKQAIEQKIIIPQSKSIGRIQGSSYGAKDFLLGAGREKFQQTFTAELERICQSKKILIHSAFIRHLTIPDSLLMPIRESFISVEKEKTAKVWEETRKSAGELEREKSLISQKRTEVEAQTNALANTIKAEAEQEVGKITAETRLLVAQKQQEIASIEASKTVLLGDAKATVARLKGEAQSQLLEAKIKAFGNDPKAYVNYSFAQKIPANLKLKMFYSGPGTMWTDLANTAGIPELSGMKMLQSDALKSSGKK